MRILKYIFLLILLFFIGITVFVTTQDGRFEITESNVIKSQKNTVFDYINDYKNWETFGSWMAKGNDITFTYPAKTSGAGAQSFWENSAGNGKIRTIFVKENDSIVQKAAFNGSEALIYWSVKDTLNYTKVTVRLKGNMGMISKIKCFFKGGMGYVLKNACSKSLHNLDETLVREMKSYSIKVNGIVSRKSGYCLKQTFSCRLNSISKNIKIVMPTIVHFFRKNKIRMAGKPYVIYERYEPSRDFATLSVCVPTTEQVFVTSGSDIASGEIQGFTCLKTTLIGDYSHLREAWNKAKKYISDNGLKENYAGKYTEVYSRTIDEVKQPSKWVTEIYIPVFPKTVEVQPETTTETPETPAEANASAGI